MVKESLRRSDFGWFLSIPTRWMDNDVYGHVNNVVYYSYFDTVVNTHLIEEGGLDIHASAVFGVVVETSCRYWQELCFPEVIEAGIRVVHLGRRSVQYEVGLFRKDVQEPAAAGRFVHVYIDRQTRKSVAIPETIRAALTPLVVASEAEESGA